MTIAVFGKVYSATVENYGQDLLLIDKEDSEPFSKTNTS
tara:strand:+ start:268 stop:384 length:117 start_codon:yes stop_codon:yes gene_type:complete